jgi:NAD(P)-dependent dehydrogenase (short-subunit alcohol dehydrogenase family)
VTSDQRISFADRVVVITGAGNGLGRTFALEFARREACVVVNDLPKGSGERSDAEAVVESIRNGGGIAVASEHSVADPIEAKEIVADALREFGRVDIVVNNAGANHWSAIQDSSVELLQRHFALHVQGSFVVTKAAYENMLQRKQGRVIFMSSSAGVFGRSDGVAYAMAKTALIGMMNTLAIEGRQHGVTANAVLPIATTAISQRSRGEVVTNEEPPPEPEMDPRFIAPLVMYLASDECTSTQGVFSAALGRYARVFTGIGEGWRAETRVPPTIEEIAANWEQVSENKGLTFPSSVFEEVESIGPTAWKVFDPKGRESSAKEKPSQS